MSDTSKEKTGAGAAETLLSFATPKAGLYVVGTYDVGVTIYSQQIRALNLAWALVECGLVKTRHPSRVDSFEGAKNVAIIGGGFAGLTIAASLIKKGVIGDITLFERRDTLLPLQQGSDSRWVHPKIYDWPAKGSEMASAALPVLNWNAGRASDVAVQILREWKKIVKSIIPSCLAENPDIEPATRLSVFCNTNHLQVHNSGISEKSLRIEWVGDNRPFDNDEDVQLMETISQGTSKCFDIVILAVGFGLERDQALSYWRNETLSQPYLGQGRITYIVSGQGDGAMIDLLRIRIAEFRQDRILSELFDGESTAIFELRNLQDRVTNRHISGPPESAFELLEGIYERVLAKISKKLGRRLRRDTQVVLHTKVKRISDLFDGRNAKISFQNKILVYLLYKCGGFIPSSTPLEQLEFEYSVPVDRIVRRHGTLRDELLEELLDVNFFDELQQARRTNNRNLIQEAQSRWPAGFFDYYGSVAEAAATPNHLKRSWRREYLPASTELISSAFCAAVAGYLTARPEKFCELRVTLHRVVAIGDEEFMQQACQYVGNSSAERMLNTAGRTFPPTHATIGLAYKKKKIVASELEVDSTRLQETLVGLKLGEASRNMSNNVQSLLAIPLLCPNGRDSDELYPHSRVFAMLYVDSYTQGCFTPDTISVLNHMCLNFVSEVERISLDKIERISNYISQQVSGHVDDVAEVKHLGLVVHEDIEPPKANSPLALNFDHADFILI